MLRVRLTPKGGRDALDGIAALADGTVVLKARVRAAPEDGAANAALVRLLADRLDTPASKIEIVRGHAARLKEIRIVGEAEVLVARLDRLLEGEEG